MKFKCRFNSIVVWPFSATCDCLIVFQTLSLKILLLFNFFFLYWSGDDLVNLLYWFFKMVLWWNCCELWMVCCRFVVDCDLQEWTVKCLVLWVVICCLICNISWIYCFLCYWAVICNVNCQLIVGCDFVKNVLSNRFNLFHILK